MTVRVATVEDDRHYRSSLEALFAHARGFAIGSAFRTADEALLSAAQSRARAGGPPWDLLLMDLALPGTDGITATRLMKEMLPDIPIVVLTAFEEPRRVLDAICSGADGYLAKRAPAAEILGELRSILAGGAPLSSGVAKTVLELLRVQATAPPHRTLIPINDAQLSLTEREHDVLRGLGSGLSYKEIASELDISIDTVRTHVRHLYSKLHVRSVGLAVRVALERGLI